MSGAATQALPSSFRALLRAELAHRCARNPRYSLRAFARSLKVDHATLSQLLRGRRQVTRAVILRLGRRLGLDEEGLSALATADTASGAQNAHAGIGALAARVAEDPTHHLLLSLVAEGAIPPNTRRVARALDIEPDDANVVIQRLVALGLLALEGPTRWRDVEGLGRMSPEAFVRIVWRRAADAIQKIDTAAPAPGAPERETQMPDPVARFQILSMNAEAAARFYASVFGWSIDPANALGYRQLSTGSDGIGGGIWPAPPEAHPFVQLFIAVDDVAASVERARAAGARVLVPVQRLPDGDEMAILADPEGIPFGLMRKRGVASVPAGKASSG